MMQCDKGQLTGSHREVDSGWYETFSNGRSGSKYQAGNLKRTDQVHLDTHLHQVLSFSRVCGFQTSH
jgi:hypothetical protein